MATGLQTDDVGRIFTNGSLKYSAPFSIGSSVGDVQIPTLPTGDPPVAIWTDNAITIVNQDTLGNISIVDFPAGGSFAFGFNLILASGTETSTLGNEVNDPRTADTTNCTINIMW